MAAPPEAAYSPGTDSEGAREAARGHRPSKDCDIQVTDPNVSRRHAEMRHEGATYWLVDLDSTNGIESHGKRVQATQLEDGTRFTIGSTELVFSREPQ